MVCKEENLKYNLWILNKFQWHKNQCKKLWWEKNNRFQTYRLIKYEFNKHKVISEHASNNRFQQKTGRGYYKNNLD